MTAVAPNSMDAATPIAAAMKRSDRPEEAELEQRYLVALNIPVFAWRGEMYTDRLWLLDLRRHLDYIRSLALFCPVATQEPPSGCEVIPRHQPPYDRLQVVATKPANSLVSALALAPRHFAQAWSAVRNADIVHGGGIGWPIPLGYYCAIAARIQNKFHISVMESSPWRLLPSDSPSMGKRIRAGVMERMASWIARHSDLALFTTQSYRNSMVGAAAPHAHVFKASWIPEQQLSPMTGVESRWSARENDDVLRIGFVARLTVEKGTRVLLDSLRTLNPHRRFEVSILGEGPCSVDIAATIAPSHVVLRTLGTVEYGDPFFRVLDEWDVIVVPSLSDEQPRIVYDAFARGVPVVASRTSALAECVSHECTGLTFEVGNSSALAECLNSMAENRVTLGRMGRNARAAAEAHTHARMHQERQALIHRAWAARMR